MGLSSIQICFPNTVEAFWQKGLRMKVGQCYTYLRGKPTLRIAHGSEKIIEVDELEELREYAQKQEVPFGLLEPLVDGKEQERLRSAPSNYRSTLNPIDLLSQFLLHQTHLNFGHLDEESFTFRLINRAAEKYATENPETAFDLRNLMMAEMAFAFIREFGDSQAQRATYALNIGLFHLGTVKTLQMDSDERAFRIKQHSAYQNGFYNAPTKNIGYAVLYDASRAKWKNRQFKNTL